VLEDLAAAGAVEIRLSLLAEGDAVGLLIRVPTSSRKKAPFYRRKFGLAERRLRSRGTAPVSSSSSAAAP
jgi:hypothetical protein